MNSAHKSVEDSNAPGQKDYYQTQLDPINPVLWHIVIQHDGGTP